MIQKGRVRLRALEREDLPIIHGWWNNYEVRQFLRDVYPASFEETTMWFQNIQYRRDERNFLIEQEEGHLIGMIGLRRLNFENRSGELGVYIGEKRWWGKGYGEEAVNAMLHLAFDTINLHRVYLFTFDFNSRAQATFQRCGFRDEGRLRQALFRGGQWWDELVMGILNEEFSSINIMKEPDG